MAEVGVAQLRRELKDWLDRAQSGDEVVITERGRPVARLSGVDTGPLLDRLADEGRISRAPRRPARLHVAVGEPRPGETSLHLSWQNEKPGGDRRLLRLQRAGQARDRRARQR
jgi:prevent-host-death family protein